jgi:diketogulonate reductase-like aldo/keto reductase
MLAMMFLNLFVGLGIVSVVQAQKPGHVYMEPSPAKGTVLNTIPRIGLGTARMRGNTSEGIAQAIVNGFRHLDCAFIYGNQKDVAIGIKEGLRRTGLSRSDLWITSKLWVSDNRYDLGMIE